MDLKDLRVLPGGVVRNMESGFGMSYSRNPSHILSIDAGLTQLLSEFDRFGVR